MDNGSNAHIYDYLVVGKGLMGAAAARYLSQVTPNVAIVGPDEPADWAGHEGVFASHYDQGRITRCLSRDVTWSLLAQRAISQYGHIEATSGVSFYTPQGCLYVAPHDTDTAYLNNVAAISQRFGVDALLLGSMAELGSVTERLRFPANCHGLWEPPPAGYINPRAMVQAQLTIAQQQGARLVAEEVRRLEAQPAAVEVVTENGRHLWARHVLVATGAFGNTYALLPRPLDLRVKSETILLARLPAAEAERLRDLPPVLYQIESPTLDSIYLLPPIVYPDGRSYLKMGCNTTADHWLPDLDAMRAWMIRGNSDALVADLRAALHEMIPDLVTEESYTHRCLVTYTTHGRPYIDQVAERLFVAVGGNGASAKCADTLGWLAANLMQTGGWSFAAERELFRVAYA